MRGRLPGAWMVPLLLAGLAQPGRGQEQSKVDCYPSISGTVYNYGALSIHGDEYIPFQKYAGKLLLFVNVATF
ncbi:Glutathione peroxidase 3 [Varanus komodoensis]|nr:Glutathione peroxidase 3 [Varanus komodoensis]